MAISDTCEFCSEFDERSDNAFAVHYATEVRDRTVFETTMFKILPSLGQIVPGYLLIVPKRHYVALGDMTRVALQELEEIRGMLLARLYESHGTFIFFEHGTRTTDCGGCGITHAHLHAVPFSRDVDPIEALKKEFASDEVNEFADLALIPASSSYLYYEAASKKRYAFYPSFLPSQYVRRLLAEAIGVHDWDWRRSGKEEKFITTLTAASRLLAGPRP